MAALARAFRPPATPANRFEERDQQIFPGSICARAIMNQAPNQFYEPVDSRTLYIFCHCLHALAFSERNEAYSC